MMPGTAIVISPLIALMKNQVDAIRNISEKDHVAHFLNSSLTKSMIDQVKSDITGGHTKLLYVAPESLIGRGLAVRHFHWHGKNTSFFSG